MGKKSKNSAANTTIYGKTTTTNPYVTSKTDNSGTVSAFNQGTALDVINNFVNANMEKMLDNYLNPSLNNDLNKAKVDNFSSNLSSLTERNVENDIINPLSKRNMLRSSQASDLYNKLAQQNALSSANYMNELMNTSQNDMANLIGNLMIWYMNGYDVLNDTQRQSLSTSQGNATRTQTLSNGNGGLDSSTLLQMALRMVK